MFICYVSYALFFTDFHQWQYCFRNDAIGKMKSLLHCFKRELDSNIGVQFENMEVMFYLEFKRVFFFR